MTGELFTKQLDDLMERALADKDHSLPRMIYELDMAKARIVRLQMAIEGQMAAASLAKSIVGPNGQLPPGGRSN